MKNWFCTQTKSKLEHMVDSNLKRLGYETYCPRILVDRRRGISKETEILFPNYIFVRLSPGEDNFRPVMKCHGVVAMVRFGLWFATIPDSLIDEMKEKENQDGFHILPKIDYEVGDEVRIKTGLFQGYSAIVSAKKQERIVIFLDVANQRNVLSAMGKHAAMSKPKHTAEKEEFAQQLIQNLTADKPKSRSQVVRDFLRHHPQLDSEKSYRNIYERWAPEILKRYNSGQGATTLNNYRLELEHAEVEPLNP